ncbi:MAG: hypothetical protein AAFS10_27550, partial [Myxococcota bacterium]
MRDEEDPMENADKVCDALLARLTADTSPARERLVELWIDNLLAMRLDALLSPSEATRNILASTRQETVERFITTHLGPSRVRTRQRWTASRETPGHLLAPEARAHLEALVSRTSDTPSELPLAWARGAVEPELIRELMAPVLQDVLLKFTRKLPRPSLSAMAETSSTAAAVSKGLGGLRSRIKSRVGRRAERLVDASKSVLGGIGSEFEQKLQNAAQEFSQSATQEVRDAIKERLESDEGQALTAKIRLQLLQRFLDTPFTELVSDVDDVGMQDLAKVLGPSADHNRARQTFVQGLQAELESWFESEGPKTLQTLFDDAGILDNVRA